ncbi:GNAT family N-acetyltransferase [Desulfogranum mediterraneum]|uniref:GNAT family N-acetyltransferase n=1 Tax=Desulfogranum mediterraneum TaxID=160661 RepID=UPI00048CE7B9|nr:GNAT family N-acetyltransferase [Desulfogranum mediterraneum]
MYVDTVLYAFVDNVPFAMRCLKQDDVTSQYINALNNEKKYLETKPVKITQEGQREYVGNVVDSCSNVLAGLFRGGELIGTSGGQFSESGDATIGIFLFDDWRRKNLGAVLVWMMCEFVRREFGAGIMRAGMKKENKPSLGSFLHCGFEIASARDEQYSVMLEQYKLKVPKGCVKMN